VVVAGVVVVVAGVVVVVAGVVVVVAGVVVVVDVVVVVVDVVSGAEVFGVEPVVSIQMGEPTGTHDPSTGI
jgi:hypothetical protein